MVGQRTAPGGRREQVEETQATRTEVAADVEPLWSPNWAPLLHPGTRSKAVVSA